MKRNRNTLKGYFNVGKLPTADNFVDLVDSTLNMMDDGFSRSPDNGVEIALEGSQYKRLMTFFDKPGANSPMWSIDCDPNSNGNLGFVSEQLQVAKDEFKDKNVEPSVLVLTPDGSVGVGVSNPDKLLCVPTPDKTLNVTLDVGGAVKSLGRSGQTGSVPANGTPQDITPWLEGCNAFEVMAGVGLEGQKKGRYAILHAFALNTFNPKRRWFNFFLRKRPIRCQHAWYLSRGDRLQLRWVGQDEVQNDDGKDPRKYKLQIRSVTSYGDVSGKPITIQYSITQLWFDRFMAKSTPDQPPAQPEQP